MKKIFIFSFCTITILFSTRIEMMVESCKAKKAGACTEAALMYSDGTGTEQNSTQAKFYYKKACDLGDHFACEKLDTFEEAN